MRVACLFRGNLRNENRNEYDFDRVILSIKKIFNNSNIDFYMHLWSDFPNMEIDIYKKHFLNKNIHLENNTTYADDISNIVNYYNSSELDLRWWNNEYITDPEIPYVKSRFFGQVSSSISFEKVSNLFYQSNYSQYDLVFITRPDLIFTEKLENLIVNDDIVYFNKHGDKDCSGDYCFIMSPNNVKLFGNLYTFLIHNKDKIIPRYHWWLYFYIKNICNKKVEITNIKVAENCEIYYHLGKYPEIINKLNDLLKF